MISFVDSSWPLKPVILSQTWMKGTMDFWVSDTQWYLDYNRFLYHTVSENIVYDGSLCPVWNASWRSSNEHRPTAEVPLAPDGCSCDIYCSELYA